MAEKDKKPAFVPVVKRAVTRAVLKFDIDVPAYVKILTEIITGKELKGNDKKAEMKPAQICDVIDLETGQELTMICGSIVESSLNENYTKKSYVGLCFAITKQKKKEGKRYFPYEISEIEDPNPTETKK